MGKEDRQYNQIIIGSGAAGLTAAIYSGRAALEPLVFEGELPGGQLTQTTEVENFPGFEQGVMGPELMQTMRKQADRFGAQFFSKAVSSVDLSPGALTVTAGGETHATETIIIATGASPRMLGLEAERKFMGKGVSTCATCDAFFYRGKTVAVVGGGDSAMEEASFISKFASKVYLIHRRDQFRASQIMQERVFGIDNIEIIWDSVAVDIVGDDKGGVRAAVLENVKSGAKRELPVDGFFLAIGHIPNSELFREKLSTDENGYITVFDGTATSVPGVFAAGDVVDHRYRQAVTAAGMGCMASLDAEKFIARAGK